MTHCLATRRSAAPTARAAALFVTALALATALGAGAAHAQTGGGLFAPNARGHAGDVGIGFYIPLNDRSPGGFKFFVGYDYSLTARLAIDVQLNVGLAQKGCFDSPTEGFRCQGFGRGQTVDGVAGVIYKWILPRSPRAQLHLRGGALVGGIFVLSQSGLMLGGRVGFGARFFLAPSFALGGEVGTNMGVAFFSQAPDAAFIATIDVNVGLEWRL